MSATASPERPTRKKRIDMKSPQVLSCEHIRAAHGREVSRQRRWPPRLCVGPNPGTRSIRHVVTPDHLRRFTIGVSKRLDLRRIDRSVRAGEAADRTGPAMLAMLAALIALLVYRNRAVVTDFGDAQRIGRCDRGCPARRN